VKVVRGTARIARLLSYVAALATLLFVLALHDDGWKLGLAAIAAGPAVVLFLFSTALLEAAELPGRLRGAPADAAELQASLGQLSRARRGRLFRPLWRTGRAALGVRELVTPWAPLLPLLNVPFLVATVLSALATPFVLLLSLVVLVAST
jgi:hypothetical protein